MVGKKHVRCEQVPVGSVTVCVGPEGPNGAPAASSESSGVGSGGGNWMLVRSGREPPVLWAAGLSEVVSCWSGDGNMLQKTTWAVNVSSSVISDG